MASDLDFLQAALAAGLGDVRVDTLAPSLARVLVPNPRYLHDAVIVTVEHLSDGRFRLTDAGELRFTFDDDAAELVRILHCSGSPIELEDSGVATYEVEEPDGLAQAVLSFAHALIAAPTVWNGIVCASERPERPTSIPPVKQMARTCKAHLANRAGGQAGALLRLDHRVIGRAAEPVISPLAMASDNKRPPWLMASFISHQSDQAAAMSKRNTVYLWSVTRDLQIPKFVVVDDPTQVDHYADLFDRDNVVTTSVADYEPLVSEVKAQLTQAGF